MMIKIDCGVHTMLFQIDSISIILFQSSELVHKINTTMYTIKPFLGRSTDACLL